MGLIKAGVGALGGTLADQWKEFFYCEALPQDVIMRKGQKQTGRRSSNTKASDNIISNGSAIAVADGQCMIIVEQGKIVEVCAEPGEFIYDTSTEPSLFSGRFGQSVKDSFKTLGRRFTFGGDTGKDQRVYYFNTKELLDNKFGTPTPIPFRIVDSKLGFDLDTSVRCSGIYSFRLSDPILFYTEVCGNVTDEYRRENIEGQLKAEFIDALQPTFAKISELEIRPSQLPAHNQELKNAANEMLADTWGKRGLEVGSIALNPVTIPPEDADRLKNLQQASALSNPGLAAGHLVGAQAEAMKTAAGNTSGAMNGFMGMGFAQGMGGMNAQNLYAMQQQQQQQMQQQPQQPAAGGAGSWKCKCGTVNTGKFCANCGSPKPEPVAANSWKCKCGTVNTGKFCANCGSPKPAEEVGWTCSCGTVNKGKFCQNCGKKKPAGAPLYRCDKCGWEPEDPMHPPKFCPECGDIFDDGDIK